MKPFIIISYILCYSATSFAQMQTKVYIGVNQTVDHYFRNTESNLHLGAELRFSKSSLILFGAYSYGGVVNYTKEKLFHKNFKPYQLDYHLIGGGVKYIFYEPQSFLRLSLIADVKTEIHSKYTTKGLILSEKKILFSPTEQIYPYYYISTSKGVPNKLLYYHTYNYISTPLVGSFIIGNEFRLFENFYVEIQLGYMFRAFRYFYNQWLPDESASPVNIVDTHRLKDTPNGTTVYEHYFEMGLGLNYSFSFKSKKEK